MNFTLNYSKNNDFLSYFCSEWQKKKLFSAIFCISHFVFNFCDFPCFPYRRKLATLCLTPFRVYKVYMSKNHNDISTHLTIKNENCEARRIFFFFFFFHFGDSSWLGICSVVTLFVPVTDHAPITTHQRHFQFKICGTMGVFRNTW